MSYTKVIIRSHVFDYAEKAPFVDSGKSVLGAMEYDPENSMVKCHECGEGFDCISHTHLKSKHQHITVDQYKARHGLNATSGLCTPEFSAMRRTQRPAPSSERTAILVAAGREYKRVHGNNKSNRSAQVERSNALGRCQAQTLFRIQVLAAEVRRTPTAIELVKAGIDNPLLARQFGNTTRALELAGLSHRPGGRPVSHQAQNLPAGFPTKEQLLTSRMPWLKHAPCSRKACVFPVAKDGLCAVHLNELRYQGELAQRWSSSLGA